MSTPSKRAVRHVYLLNPAREPEQELMIYVPVDVWRDLLYMTGVGLFFGVGKGSNIDSTGEVCSPLGAKDKRGLPLVERSPRNIPPPPDQAHAESIPYPGIGLQQTRHGVDGVVAISKGEAEVIGKMLRVWAHLETRRALQMNGQPERALGVTRKQREANEEEINVGRAAQWTVPPHENWRAVAQQLGEWLCVQTRNPATDIYISMNPDALEQAARRDMSSPAVFGKYPERFDLRRVNEGPAAPPKDRPPNPARIELLERLQDDLPGEWDDGGARGALLWVSPFAITVSVASTHARSLVVTANHLSDVSQRRQVVGWKRLRQVLANLVAETIYHRLWGGTEDGLGPVWAETEVRATLTKMRAYLTEGNRSWDDTARKMVARIDRLLALPEQTP